MTEEFVYDDGYISVILVTWFVKRLQENDLLTADEMEKISHELSVIYGTGITDLILCNN